MIGNICRVAATIAAIFILFAISYSVESISRENLELGVLYLPSGDFLEQATLGYSNLAADILWLRTIQYYGGYRIGENDLALFNHLVDVTTDLDPQFKFAYIFGALIIAEDLGHIGKGIKFLEKGMKNNPDYWWFPFETGFLYYVYEQDYERALDYFRKASELPDAGDITKRFAAYVAYKAGHRETSIRMWKELARSAGNESMRELAKQYIEKFDEEMGLEEEEVDY